ncbi:hypothetical protein E2C01_005084 [Portunus trituberculatus]|uniref:Uncharacterized protein n=1 Tax=Portunus trituberculatus TaxID=210409 RepID=A0A5B7CUL9_PORTR|nr:hypothetical protein [Portunus trituberculatus]
MMLTKNLYGAQISNEPLPSTSLAVLNGMSGALLLPLPTLSRSPRSLSCGPQCGVHLTNGCGERRVITPATVTITIKQKKIRSGPYHPPLRSSRRKG